MSFMHVDTDLCKKDGICIQACPSGAIKEDADGFPVESGSAACIQCGHCVAICPHGAIELDALPLESFWPMPASTPTSEEIQALMESRRSIREFKQKAVPREVFERMLDIVRYAPTAVNTQKVQWIINEDPATTRKLAEIVAEWMRGTGALPGYLSRWDAGRDVILRGAPHVAVACTPRDYDWGGLDCAIALTYMELAAPSFGLGACWAGILTRAMAAEPSVTKALSVPDDLMPHGALMIGFPKFAYRLIPPRNAAVTHWI